MKEEEKTIQLTQEELKTIHEKGLGKMTEAFPQMTKKQVEGEMEAFGF